MKNTVRARLNGGKTPPATQAQNQPSNSKKNYCLSLLEWQSGNADRPIIVGEIGIQQETFAALDKKSTHCGQSFAQLLAIGLRAMVDAFPICEPENAMLQANALAMLLFQNMEYERTAGGNFSDKGETGGNLGAGLQQLVWKTQQRLTRATYDSQKTEVAS